MSLLSGQETAPNTGHFRRLALLCRMEFRGSGSFSGDYLRSLTTSLATR